MKKSLSAILVIILSFLGANAYASSLEIKNLKSKISNDDSTQPGGNGLSPNGVKKSKGSEM